MPTLEPNTNTLAPDQSVPLQPTDSELLLDFVRHRQQRAFAELVDKHAAMVLGVCRQILRDPHDAEDAFQATFMILALRAEAIQKSASVGAWLHRVAYRTAMRAAKRRQQRKTEPLADIAGEEEVWSNIAQQELQTVLHHELARLPQRYRAVLVLCYLEGKTRNDAADELECTEQSVKALLARGRQLLRMRLARRGALLSVVLGVAAMSSRSAEAAALESLVEHTAETIGNTILRGEVTNLSTNFGTLAREGVLAMRLSNSLRIIAPVLLLIGAGVGLVLSSSLLGQSAAAHAAGPENADRGGDQTITVVPADDTAELATAHLVATDDVADPRTENVTDQATHELDVTAGLEQPEHENIPSWPNAREFALNLAAAVEKAETQEEAALEVEYLEAKLKAMQLYAEAKRQQADSALKEVEQGMVVAARVPGSVNAVAIAKFKAAAAINRAEAENISAEVIRLRRELLGAKRRVANLADTDPAIDATTEKPAPRKLAPGDKIYLDVVTNGSYKIGREVTVEPEGTVPLGAQFGRSKVAGLTIAEAEAKVASDLKSMFRQTYVQITFP